MQDLSVLFIFMLGLRKRHMAHKMLVLIAVWIEDPSRIKGVGRQTRLERSRLKAALRSNKVVRL